MTCMHDIKNPEAIYRALLEAVPEPMVVVNERKEIVLLNGQAQKQFGYCQDELSGQTITKIIPQGFFEAPHCDAAGSPEVASAHQPGAPISLTGLHRDGTAFPIEVSLSSLESAGGVLVIAAIRETTRRGTPYANLHQLAENVHEVFWMTTPESCTVVYVSPAYELIWGRSVQSLYDNPKQWLEAIHDDDRSEMIKFAEDKRNCKFDVEYRIVRPDGEVRWILDRAFPVYDDNGEIYRAAGVARDITERKRLMAQIEHMAQHDTVTGLGNRVQFTARLARAIARSHRTGGKLAVLFLDLDQFKNVNDTHGHAIGDRVLQMVAERLRAGVRLNDDVARFGGDEFTIMLEDPPELTEFGTFLDRLIAIVSEPYCLDGIECHIAATIGVAICTEGRCETETLIANADTALYRAKAAGRRTYRLFSDAMDEEVRERANLTNELHRAVRAGEFFLVYQPQIDARTGRIVGVEALVRWAHPQRGTVAPADFLPLAESTGLMGPIGKWVLREACRQGREWIDAGMAPGTIAVNVSNLQFQDPQGLEKNLLAVLAETGYPAHLLELEITETTLIGLTAEHEQVVQRLRGLGVRFALDDFGTGYSSLEYLQRFQIDRIKIAREFISRLPLSQKAGSIVRLVLALARDLGSDVVAEGVETLAQLNMLQDWECQTVQGFYSAVPMSAEVVAPLLRRGSVDVSIAASRTDAGVSDLQGAA